MAAIPLTSAAAAVYNNAVFTLLYRIDVKFKTMFNAFIKSTNSRKIICA